MSKTYDKLDKLVNEIVEKYDLIGEQEYENVITMFNQVNEPLYKIVSIYEGDPLEERVYIMFNLDVVPTEAIQWFAKLRMLHPDLDLAENWAMINGEVVSGPEAEYLKSQQRVEAPVPLSEAELKELDKKPHITIRSAYEALKVIKEKGKGNGH